MAEEIRKLDSPIDVMYLIHKAFQAYSERAEQMAAQLEGGGDLRAFKEVFDFWGKQLLYHATAEDKYMTAPLIDCQPARDNETEHAALAHQVMEVKTFVDKGDTAGLAESLKAAMVALQEKQHNELTEKLEDVEKVLRKEIGENKVVARTRRHLYKQVMALRIAEFDHFENEEAFVLPPVRERMSGQQQLEVARRLLIDEGAQDPRWIIGWVVEYLTPKERNLLAVLEARFMALSPQIL